LVKLRHEVDLRGLWVLVGELGRDLRVVWRGGGGDGLEVASMFWGVETVEWNIQYKMFEGREIQEKGLGTF